MNSLTTQGILMLKLSRVAVTTRDERKARAAARAAAHFALVGQPYRKVKP